VKVNWSRTFYNNRSGSGVSEADRANGGQSKMRVTLMVQKTVVSTCREVKIICGCDSE